MPEKNNEPIQRREKSSHAISGIDNFGSFYFEKETFWKGMNLLFEKWICAEVQP